MSGVDFKTLELGSGDVGSLAFITLTDPGRDGNTLDTPLLSSLIEQLEVWQNENIRAVILHSISEIAFSVGMNFNTFKNQTQSRGNKKQEAARLYRQCLASIYHFPAPVICLLEKPARAGGVGLVMAADLVLASEEASLTLGEALFGLIPANVLPYLRKRISESRAKQMVFIPEALDAPTLQEWGLSNFLTSSADLERQLKKLLRNLLRCSPEALAKQKSFCHKLSDLPLNEQQKLAEQTLAACLEEPAVQAGISAFLDGGIGPWCAKVPKSLLSSKENDS